MGRDDVLGAVRGALGRKPGDGVAALEAFSWPHTATGDPVARFRAALEAVAGELVDARGRDPEALLEPYRQIGAGIVRAAWGVAEAGSVVIERDRDHLPSLLPEVTVILLDAANLVVGLENLPVADAQARARIIITGPSRTADIEKRLVLGAHGPRRVVVVLTDGARPA